MKSYNPTNFHKRTFCYWEELAFEDVDHLKFELQSKSGSSYAFTEDGVYRKSNHWGRVAQCRWTLLAKDGFKSQRLKMGFARWEDFYPNDEKEKVFFVLFNSETFQTKVYHKFSPYYDEKFTLRTGNETAKTMQLVKDVISGTAWAKHLAYDDIHILRKEVLEALLLTDKSILQIKKAYY